MSGGPRNMQPYFHEVVSMFSAMVRYERDVIDLSIKTGPFMQSSLCSKENGEKIYQYVRQYNETFNSIIRYQ